MPAYGNSDLQISDNFIENSNISLKIENSDLSVNGIKISLKDFADRGDSYNFGPDKNDSGVEFKLLRARKLINNSLMACLKIDFESSWDIISLYATLYKSSNFIELKFEWDNTRKNHLVCVNLELKNPIKTVYSEDMNTLIKRTFNPDYNIRTNLPYQKGIEAKNNTAPMQRGLLIDENENNIGVITKGLTQYEIFQNNLLIPILRATGQISNPDNPARTTPAGPPIEVNSLQMIGKNTAQMYVFFGNENDFNKVLNQVYNYIII